MAQVRLKYPEGGELILDGDSNELPWEDKELWQCELRRRREYECFPIVNRGQPWYDRLSAEQKQEFGTWYEQWLDAPETGEIPQRPDWIEVNGYEQ